MITAPAAMVATRGVGVDYGARQALSDVTIEVGGGEWLGIIGPNGAGKSSLLKAIAGLQRAEGEVWIGGTMLSTMDRRERAQAVAYVPQEPVLPRDMSALDYVLLGRTAHLSYFGSPSRPDYAIAREALERLDLAHFAGRMLAEMSGGERQRVVLARALATRASVLLLDEPTTALDIGHQLQALDLVDHLCRSDGLTVIAAMHDLSLAGSYCDRLVLVQSGVVGCIGNPAEVITPSRIKSVFGADVLVVVDEQGLVVTPLRGRNGRALDGSHRSTS